MKPSVVIVMGSDSDWKTLKHASTTLDQLGVPHEVKVISAHRTPDLLFSFAEELEKSSIQVVIAGAGGAAHLPGMIAAKTQIPVFGVPIETKTLQGLDSLLSINQMPKGVPVATLAIGEAGAVNSALMAAAVLSLADDTLRKKLQSYRKKQTQRILALAPLRPKRKS